MSDGEVHQVTSGNEDSMYALRFQQDTSAPGNIEVPDANLTDRIEHGAGDTVKGDPVNDDDPFTGNGFTSSTVPGERIIPEMKAEPVTMQPGTVI